MLKYFFGRHGSIFCTEILSHRLRHQNLKSQIGGPSSVCLVSLGRMRRVAMTMMVFGNKKKSPECTLRPYRVMLAQTPFTSSASCEL